MAQDDSFSGRIGRAIVRLATLALVASLAAVAVFLLAKLNSRTYRVQLVENQLRVMKGKNQPFGFEPFRPSDPQLLDAYAPIQLAGENPADILNRTFNERDELDRALFSVFETLGRPKLFSEDPQEVQQGLYYLRRAEKLTGVTEEQRRTLKNMQSEIAYHQGREKLDDARKTIAEALIQLKIAADAMNRNSRSANVMLLEVAPAAKQLEEALRRAVFSLSAPVTPPVEKAPDPERPEPLEPKPEPKPDASTPRPVPVAPVPLNDPRGVPPKPSPQPPAH
jgi:hypothetical protein